MYSLGSIGLLLFIRYNSWALNALDLSTWELYYGAGVLLFCSGAGIYKVVERLKKLKKYLTYLKE
jgi:hypothetical protein